MAARRSASLSRDGPVGSAAEPGGAAPRSLYRSEKSDENVPRPRQRRQSLKGAVVTQEPQTDSLATRRGVLVGAGLVGLAGVITACGAGGSSSAPAGNGTSAASTPAGQAASSEPAASAPASAATSAAS